MTVLVTGAGLIACHSAKALLKRGERVVFYDLSSSEEYIQFVLEGAAYEFEQGDILDLPNLIDVAKKHDVNGLVHTAAFLPERAAKQPALAAQVNVIGAVNLFELHRIASLRRTVFISTIGIFDQNQEDGHAWEEDHLLGPDTIYGCTKLSAELIGLHYAKAYGVDLVSLRFSPVFGIGNYYTSPAGTFIRDVLEPAALTGASEIRREFSNTNQYLYALDAGEAVALAFELNENPDTRVFNISEGCLRTANEVVELAEKAIPNAKISIQNAAWEASKDRHFVTEPFSLHSANHVLGFKPSWPMDKAFKDYAEQVRRRANKTL